MKIEASVEVSNVVVVAASAIVALVAGHFISELFSDDEQPAEPERPIYATFRDVKHDIHQAFL